MYSKGKVHPCTGHSAHRESRGIALLFLNHGTRRRWVVSITPRPLFTLGKTRYPLYRRLGGPQGGSGQVQKISPPLGFDPRTIQPVVSRYTDWDTRPVRTYSTRVKFQWPGTLQHTSQKTWVQKAGFITSAITKKLHKFFLKKKNPSIMNKSLQSMNCDHDLHIYFLVINDTN